MRAHRRQRLLAALLALVVSQAAASSPRPGAAAATTRSEGQPLLHRLQGQPQPLSRRGRRVRGGLGVTSRRGDGRAVELQGVKGTFPESQDPVTAEPAPFDLPNAKCTVNLFQNATLNSYNKVATSTYSPPSSDCAYHNQEWSRVLLRWRGAVKGVQFDRYGAMWIGGVEVLRTTTPEPDPNGIRWNITRDLTEYSELLRKSDLTAALSIPNVVDSTYTGVLYISADIEFYYDDGTRNNDSSSSPPSSLSSSRPLIIPLRDPVTAAVKESTSPWSIISATAEVQNVWAEFTSPVKDVVRGYIDLYASAHECEEFWYSNVPNKTNETAGLCYGGAQRQLEVRIDGLVSGVAAPFPVIYTGGVNPILWRPLTGILSFDIPPYRIDISPFVGVLNSGKTVNISLSVRAKGGSDWQSVWYLDAVLVLYRSGIKDDMIVGPFPTVRDSGLKAKVTESLSTSQNQTFFTEAERELVVEGHYTSSVTGREYASTTTSRITSTNFNSLTETASLSYGRLTGTYESFFNRTCKSQEGKGAAMAAKMVAVDFPYYVYDDETADNSTMQITADVSYARNITAYAQPLSSPSLQSKPAFNSILLLNKIRSAAIYNRSLTNHSLVNIETGRSEEEFNIASASSPSPLQPVSTPKCYDNRLAASNGEIVNSTQAPGACHFDQWFRLTGSSLYLDESMWAGIDSDWNDASHAKIL